MDLGRMLDTDWLADRQIEENLDAGPAAVIDGCLVANGASPPCACLERPQSRWCLFGDVEKACMRGEEQAFAWSSVA
jgi:hypothetical protein